MVHLKSKINIDDFLILVYWVKTHYWLEGRNFVHQHLLEQAETYQYNNTPLDTNIHKIDNFMIDAFAIYRQLKETEDKMIEIFESLPTIKTEEFMEQTKKYEEIFENIMENYKFEEPEIRGIQRGILTIKMREYVELEEYEKAAQVRDMIKCC